MSRSKDLMLRHRTHGIHCQGLSVAALTVKSSSTLYQPSVERNRDLSRHEAMGLSCTLGILEDRRETSEVANASSCGCMSHRMTATHLVCVRLRGIEHDRNLDNTLQTLARHACDLICRDASAQVRGPRFPCAAADGSGGRTALLLFR